MAWLEAKGLEGKVLFHMKPLDQHMRYIISLHNRIVKKGVSFLRGNVTPVRHACDINERHTTT